MVDSEGIEILGITISMSDNNAPVVKQLHGFVQNVGLDSIAETMDDDHSESLGRRLWNPLWSGVERYEQPL